MRPYRFAPLAPSRGLSIASGAVQGLNQGLQTLARIRMQKSQMEVHKQQADAMKIYRQAQAESMRQKAMGGTAADIRLLNALQKGEHIDPSVLKPILKDKVQTFLDTAKPEERNALAQHIEQQMNQGEIPGEMLPYININANQLRSMDRSATNTSHETVANTTKAGKVEAAGIYGDTRVKVAQIGGKAKVDAAGIAANRPSAGHSPDSQALKDSNSRMIQLQKSLDSLNKPVPLGATPLDPSVKDTLQKKYEDQLLKEHENYSSILDRAHGGGASGGADQKSNSNRSPQASDNFVYSGKDGAFRRMSQDGSALEPERYEKTVKGDFQLISPGTPYSGQPGQIGPSFQGKDQGQPAPRYLPSTQHQEAKPGDFVQYGQGYMRAVQQPGGKIGPELDEKGQFKVYPAPNQAAPAPAASPQAPQGAPSGAPGGVTIGNLPGGDVQPPPGLLMPQNSIPGAE